MAWIRVLALAGIISTGVTGAQPAAGPGGSDDRVSAVRSSIARLEQATGGSARVRVHGATRSAAWVRFGPEGFPGRLEDGPALDAERRAEAFFREHGGLFGIEDAAGELRRTDLRTDALNMVHLTYQQMYRGFPVYGAELRVHVRADGRLSAVNGLFVPAIELPATADVTEDQAAQIALATVADQFPDETLERGPLRLVVMRENLSAGLPGENHLTYEVDVFSPGVREWVYVDAHDAGVVKQISGRYDGLNRQAYLPGAGGGPEYFAGQCDNFNCDTTGINCVHDFECRDSCEAFPEGPDCAWEEGDFLDPVLGFQCTGGTPYCPAHLEDEIEAATTRMLELAQETHQFFLNLSSGTFDSWSGTGRPMHSILQVLDPSVPALPVILDCLSPGAVFRVHGSPAGGFDQASSTFCLGAATDDIIGHEWAHGYTFATHNLIYENQPGALNESYSDIWGEVLDLMTGGGAGEIDTLRTPGNCSVFDTNPDTDTAVQDTSHRWLLGEDATHFTGQGEGAIRDMWNPGCYDDPVQVDDENFICSPLLAFQSTIVHTNSGVPNRVFAVLVDGSRDGGPGGSPAPSVNGIGLSRAVDLYWRTQIVYQSTFTDFAGHADALEMSCNDLMASGMTQADCDDVSAAIEMMGLRTVTTLIEGQCEYFERCPSTHSCPGGGVCDEIGCSATGPVVEVDLGRSLCALDDDQLLTCDEGQTLHLATTTCEKCPLCDDPFPPYICPVGGCGTSTGLTCGDGEVLDSGAPITIRLTRTDNFTLIEWNPTSLAYDIMGGELTELRDSGGDFTFANTPCFANDRGNTAFGFTDSGSPPPRFYLVRPAIAGGSSYDSGGPGQVGSRDAEIAASPNACPQ